MKNLAALLLLLILGSCNQGKKETTDYAELLKIKDAIERGSGDAIQRYAEIIGPGKLTNVEADPKFIELKAQALADLNSLIEVALEKGVDKDALIACIRKNGADSPLCARYVDEVKANTSPRMERYDAELRKFLANHLEKNSHLPKGEGNCKNIHAGNFRQFIDGDTIRISRDESSETEEWHDIIRNEKVTWINDCLYKLELIKAAQDAVVPASPREFPDDCFIEIIRVTNEYYMYKIFDVENGNPGDLIDIGKVYFTK